MKKDIKKISLTTSGFLLLFFFFSSSVFAVTPGAWLISGTYKATAKYKGVKKESTNDFSDKNLTISENGKKRTFKFFVDKYPLNGTWKEKPDKLNFTINSGNIKNMIQGYLNDNYKSYVDKFDIDIDVKTKTMAVIISPDNTTLTGNGSFNANCNLSLDLGLITKKIGTISFSGTVQFEGVMQ